MIGSIIAVSIAFAGLLLFERDLPAEVVDAQYANAQSQFLRTNADDRIHFRDQGPSDAVPIILIKCKTISFEVTPFCRLPLKLICMFFSLVIFKH